MNNNGPPRGELLHKVSVFPQDKMPHWDNWSMGIRMLTITVPSKMFVEPEGPFHPRGAAFPAPSPVNMLRTAQFFH